MARKFLPWIKKRWYLILVSAGLILQLSVLRIASESSESIQQTNLDAYNLNLASRSDNNSPPSPIARNLDADAKSKSWADAISETTTVLYRDSPFLDFWLSQPPPSVYIYDTLSEEYSSVANVSACIDGRFGELPPGNCAWRPKVCQDRAKANTWKGAKFMSYRSNYNTDVAYIDKFRSYPYRVQDPDKADLFIVPYPHKSHCLCHQDFGMSSAGCAVPFKDIDEQVFQKLHHFATHKPQHVFFYGADFPFAAPRFRKQTKNSITISLGHAGPCANTKEASCGHVAIPYITTSPGYQPSALASHYWNAGDERPYAVGAAMASTKDLPLRAHFLDHHEKWIGTHSNVTKQPHKIIRLGARDDQNQMLLSQDFMNLYRNSTFCIILRGDGCPQKRFFDALLNGCIPLVPLYDTQKEYANAKEYSFFAPKSCTTRITYPFAKGSFSLDDPEAGMNVLDLVVSFNGTCGKEYGMDCIRDAVEDALAHPELLEQKRRNLQRYAALMTFGLPGGDDKEPKVYPDAFTALLVRLRHHSWHLQGRNPSNSNK